MSSATNGWQLRPGEVGLHTPRLWLRTMRAEDFAALLAIFTDPAVMAAFAAEPFTDAEMQGWLQRNLDHQHRHGFGLFAVIHKAGRELIGNCGLTMMHLDNEPVAELGYDFRRDHWGQGYATEAACAVRDYAFDTLHLPRLVSMIRVGNRASRRVAEKVGMQIAAHYAAGDIDYWRYELRAPAALQTD